MRSGWWLSANSGGVLKGLERVLLFQAAEYPLAESSAWHDSRPQECARPLDNAGEWHWNLAETARQY